MIFLKSRFTELNEKQKNVIQTNITCILSNENPNERYRNPRRSAILTIWISIEYSGLIACDVSESVMNSDVNVIIIATF